jgi:hypothetical protein
MSGKYYDGNTYHSLFGPPNGAHYASGCSGSQEGMYDKRCNWNRRRLVTLWSTSRGVVGGYRGRRGMRR